MELDPLVQTILTTLEDFFIRGYNLYPGYFSLLEMIGPYQKVDKEAACDLFSDIKSLNSVQTKQLILEIREFLNNLPGVEGWKKTESISRKMLMTIMNDAKNTAPKKSSS